MSTVANGRVAITHGSQNVYAVTEHTLTSTTGFFLPGDPLTGVSSTATGVVVEYSGGLLKSYWTSAAQPITGEKVTSTGTLSGTLYSLDEVPDFSTVAGGHLFKPQHESSSSYGIAGKSTATKIVLNSAFGGTTEDYATYVIAKSFTPGLNLPYPQKGDAFPASILSEAIIRLDSTLTSGIGVPVFAVEDSLTISGMAVATANSVAEIAASGIVFGSDIEELRKDSLSFFLSTVSGGQQVTLLEYAPYSFSITSLVCKLRAGQVNTTLSVNGVGIAGITSVTASDSQTPFTPSSGIVVSAGQRVSLKINAIASADEFAGTILGRRNF